MKLHAVCFSLLFAATLAFAELKIEHTEPHRMEGFEFTRMANLMGDKEATDPTRVAVATNPKEKSGIYFEAELNQTVASLPAGSVAVVEVLVDADRAPRTFKLPVPATKNNSKVLYLGLTDAPFVHATKKSPHLLAWKISILDKDGKTLAEAPSALWQY